MNTQLIRTPTFQRPSGFLELSGMKLNLVSGATTLIEFDQIRTGFNDGIEDTANHRITPGKAGFYSIAGAVNFFNTVADKKYRSLIYISGSDVAANMKHTSIAEAVDLPVSIATIYLSAVDYVELYAYHLAGVDTVDVNCSDTFLCVQRVR